MKVFSPNATSVDLQLLVVKIIFVLKLRKEENLRISSICFHMIKIIITILFHNFFQSEDLYKIEVKNIEKQYKNIALSSTWISALLWRFLICEKFWNFDCAPAPEAGKKTKKKKEIQRKMAWGLCCREVKQQIWWWEKLCPGDNSNFPIIPPSSLVPLLTHCWDLFPVAQQTPNPRVDFMPGGYSMGKSWFLLTTS